MALNSLCLDDQGVDEGRQVTILDVIALNPAKASREPPTERRHAIAAQLEERLAVFVTNKDEAGGWPPEAVKLAV
jgi:hypothetical protein